MPNLINQDNIGNTYLNYVSNTINSEVVDIDNYNFTSFFTTAFGDNRERFTVGSVGTLHAIAIRFPVAWETKTGAISSFTTAAVPSNARCMWIPDRADIYLCHSNSSTTLSVTYGTAVGLSNNTYTFAVLNNSSLTVASFSNVGRAVCSWFVHIGWPKSMVYTGSQYIRNFIVIRQSQFQNGLTSSSSTYMQRPTTENLTTKTDLYTASDTTLNPTISCEVATPDANGTDIIVRDATSPFNYNGKLWNVIRLPSTAVVGKIYKNTGIDPDGSNNSMWLCCGAWGSDKIGMRVWTEGIV